jgi:CheY-like chemotaxis protein
VINSAPIGSEMVSNLKLFQYTGRRTKSKNLIRISMPYAKILVVDDLITNLDVAKALLAPYDINVDAVLTGAEAVEKIREEKVRYDAILMDHMMPGMDGIEAVRVIREEIGTEYAKNVPIIALTANALVGSSQTFLQNGFQDFLSKPVNITDLDMVLNRWVKRSVQETVPARLSDGDDENGESDELQNIEIDGVDIAGGIGRYGGAEQYTQVLRSFVNHTPDLLKKITDIAGRPLKEYAIIVHGIKGAAYGVSANTVGHLAEDLEAAAKRDDAAFVLKNNPLFIKSANALLAVLGDSIKKIEVKKDVLPFPNPDSIAALKTACLEFDVQKMEAVISELESYSYQTGGDFIKTIRYLADNLEYDELLKTLG